MKCRIGERNGFEHAIGFGFGVFGRLVVSVMLGFGILVVSVRDGFGVF